MVDRAGRALATVVMAVSLSACSVVEGAVGDEGATATPMPTASDAVLSRTQVEELVVDTVAEEVGVPRVLVTGYIESNGGFDALAQRFGVTEEQLARLDQGVTREEVDAVLVPLVEELRARLGS